MTPAQRVAEALLAGDVGALRALADDPEVGEVARAGLVRLVPDDVTEAELAGLRVVSGHPGLSASELAELTGGAFGRVSGRLLELGLVTSSRFERGDCWSRTARGAQVLRRHA